MGTLSISNSVVNKSALHAFNKSIKRVRLVQRPLGNLMQITPRVLTDAFAAGGPEAKRAFAAMMEMDKIDIAKIEAARRG